MNAVAARESFHDFVEALAAANAIEAGMADLALAVGFDKHERGAFATDPAEYGIGEWYGEDGMMVTTQFFGMKIQRYLADHDLDPRLLAELSAKALRNGARNPNAWRRNALSVDAIADAEMVNDPLTKYMFCSPSEGAAAVVLASPEKARELREDPVWLKAVEFRTRKYGTFEVFSPSLAAEITPGATVDAAAAAFALMVTDPANTSVGGRAQILIRLQSGATVAIDGATETPAGVPPLTGADDDRTGYTTAAVPGAPAASPRMGRPIDDVCGKARRTFSVPTMSWGSPTKASVE